VNDCWTDAHLLRGHRHFDAGRYKEALADFQASLEFPENLRAARLRGGSGRETEVAYWVGMAYEALGEEDKAIESWTDTADSSGSRRRRRWFGGPRGSAGQYYRGLSLIKLGRNQEAEEIFQSLIELAQRSLKEAPQLDFFAKFGEQQSQRSRLANAHYLMGLGHLGLDQKDKAREEMTKALKISPDHLGAKSILARLD
jgi:tetratricopeptide (TPR) repeat protein